MRVVFIKNPMKKLIIFITLILIWVVSFIATKTLVGSNMASNVTANNYFSFFYPASYEVVSIYVNKAIPMDSIETSFSIKQPLKRNFSNYTSPEGNFIFDYPSAFIINEQKFSSSDILYHIDFHDKTNTSRGFVQVWNLSSPLKEFLDKSKSVSANTYKYFNSKKIDINNLSGYYWDYDILGSDNKYYKGMEVFLQDNTKQAGKMFRISYFAPEAKWTSNDSDIFWHMVKSFEVR